MRFNANLGSALIFMQVDVAFGDVVVPEPRTLEYPSILDFPKARLRGYSRESMVAEKFEAMVKLGIANSRMKDFYDVWFLSRQFDFGGQTLATAIKQTFACRRTVVVPEATALTERFAGDRDKQVQWRAFIGKNHLVNVPGELAEVVRALAGFLVPLAEAIASGRPFQKHWRPSGPWA